MADKPIALTPQGATRVRNALRKSEAAAPGAGAPTGRIPRDELDGFWARLGGNEVSDDDDNKFQYAWTQQRATVEGWDTLTGGLTGSTTERYALNSAEDATSATADPVEGEPVVWMHIVWAWDEAEETWVRAFRFNGAAGGDNGFWGQIGTATLITDQEARWNYPFFQVKQMLEGNVAELDDGITGTATNQVEANNAETGIGTMGSGDVISSGDFASDLKLKPIPAGAVRWIRPGTDCDGDPVWLFEANNKKTECAE